MVRVALPTSTVLDSGWELTGGAEVHECIGEGVDSADDATSFVKSTVAGDEFEVVIPNPGGPVYPGTTGYKIRVRARDFFISITHGEFIVELRVAGSTYWQSPKTTVAMGHAWTTYEHDVELALPLNDYDQLSLYLVDSDSGTGFRIGISAIEFVIPSEIPIVGGAAGEAAAAGALKGIGVAGGGAVGSSAVAAATAIKGAGALVGAVAGAASAALSLVAIGALVGTTVGASSTAAAARGVGQIVGSSACVSAAAASSPNGSGSLTGSSVGLAAAIAQPRATGALVGSAAGSAACSIEPTAQQQMGIYELISSLVRARFKAQVATPLSLATAWDDVPFTPAVATSYARLKVRCDDAGQIAFGDGNRYRKRGEATVELRLPTGRLDGAALSLAKSVVAAFREAVSEHLIFGTPQILPGFRDGAFWRVDVVCPFRGDVARATAQGSPASTPLDSEVAASVMRSRFESVANPLGLAVRWDNDPRETPGSDETWARASIVPGTSRLVERGAPNRYRTVGIFYALLFAPAETSEHALLELGDQVADEFRAVTDRGVTFKTPLVRAKGREGPWWRVDVTCPFQWDEFA